MDYGPTSLLPQRQMDGDKMKSAEKDCDNLIRQITRARDKCCRKCGGPYNGAHHIFSRKNSATRFMPEYVWGICDGCHDNFKIPDFNKWLIKSMGQEWYDRGKKLATPPVKLDYEAVRSELRGILNGIKSPKYLL